MSDQYIIPDETDDTHKDDEHPQAASAYPTILMTPVRHCKVRHIPRWQIKIAVHSYGSVVICETCDAGGALYQAR